MSNEFTVDITEIQAFFKKMDQAARGDFNKELVEWMEAIGIDFLNQVRNEIIRKQVVNTRLLLNSFQKGSKGNVWKVSHGGLTLEVGTNVEYARFVNDGHWTNKQGVSQRWVPGYWSGDRFIYDPSAKTGMLLKQKFVPGKHYWESASHIFQKIFDASLEKKMDEWIKKYFE